MEFVPTISAANLARELLAVLPRLNRLIARELRAEFGDERTIVQMRVLGELSEAPLTLSTLARKREVSVQAASEHIQSLVERGWVIRTPDPADRRQQLLSLTDEGQQQLEQVREHLARAMTPIIEQISPAEAAGIHEGLLALRRLLIDAVDANPTVE